MLHLTRKKTADQYESSLIEKNARRIACHNALFTQYRCESHHRPDYHYFYYLALSDLSLAGSARSSNAAGDASHANALAALESKMFRVTEKLKISDEKNQELTIENNQISVLKDTLRERNNNIKDLKRSLEERDKTRSSAPTDGSTAEMRIKISDLMSENRTLKQALAAATMGVRASMDRVGK